jgi:hypothetical protein
MGKSTAPERILVGIDDTDNLESRGTGFRARELGFMLAERGLARVRGISRHQLYVHPDIPYTSHNSALCLDIEWMGGDVAHLGDITRDYLVETSAEGSDAGYCIAPYAAIGDDLMTYGKSAKSTVLTQATAVALAEANSLRLEGVTGTHGGIIGALACVGLRKTGHDGRFVWVKGVRDLETEATAGYLLGETGIEVFATTSGPVTPAPNDVVSVAPWPRPVLLNHQVVLLIEKVEDQNADIDWRIVPREGTKQY